MKHSATFVFGGLALVIFVAAALGYTEYSRELSADSKANAQALDTIPAAEDHAGHNHAHDSKEVQLMKIDANELRAKPSDLQYGNPKARVRIVEYASLSCPHCASFYEEVMPKLKEAYLDGGKIAFTFRHFPLNAPAMKAAMAVACAADENKHALLEEFFNTQRDWAFDSEYLNNIAKIASKHGLDAKALELCFANTKVEDTILATRQNAEQKLNVASTPTFFVNGKRIAGAVSFEALEEAIKNAK